MEMEMNSDLGRGGGSVSSKESFSGSSLGSAFCALEEDYAKVIEFCTVYRIILNEMKTNEALAAYEGEYTRLFEALYETTRNEENLTEKCRDLQNEVIDSANKIAQLEKLNEADQDTIERLRQEIVSAMKLADAAHTREQHAQEMIENLRLSITKLNHEIDQKNKQLGVDEESAVSKQKEGLLKERDRMLGEMETLRQRLNNVTIYSEDLERKNSTVDHRMTEMQETMDTQTNEVSKERRARERAEEEIHELQEELKSKIIDLQNASTSLRSATNNVIRLENTVKDQKSANEKMQKDIDKLMLKRMNLQTEIDNANTQMEEMAKEITEKNKQLKNLTQESYRLREETEKSQKEKESITKRLFRAESDKSKAEEELERLRISQRNAELETEILSKKADADKRKIEQTTRDKDLLTKYVSNLRSTVKKLQESVDLEEQSKRKLEADLGEKVQTVVTLKRTLYGVEKERDNCNYDAQELTQQVEDQIDEVKLKQVEIFDYKKRLAEAETKYRQQQNLFEAVRADRNACSKSLIEAQDEIEDLKNKSKIMSHQIEQLKEDIASKEGSLVKDEFLLGKAEKEKDALKNDLQNVRKDMADLRSEIEEMRQKEKNLRHSVQLAEMDASRRKKEMDTIMNERDILGTQLVRRNDELSLQYSRIKILNGTIKRGEAQYGQRLEDIRLLKLEVKKLRTEKALLSKSIMNISDLRQEIFHLHRDLTKEKLKVTALEEEVQNPLNIHRWRKLEGSDPNTYELIMKIQLLQKRVLKMCSEIIEKERKIKEGEKLYMNLREVLSKQPGPEVVMSLRKTQKALRERGKTMKCLVSELNMCEAQVNEYKFDLERMNKEMCDLKDKYYTQKKNEQRIDESKLKEPCLPVLPQVPPFHKKFCGGGFNMAGPTPRNFYTLESISGSK